MSADSRTVPFGGRTAWGRNLAAPVRDFLSTETGGALVMLCATVVALVWANAASHSYESVWSTEFAIRIGHAGISTDLRHWINEGLMTFFFLVVGLEAKRELDLGELRERRRIAIPVAAAAGGMIVPVAIYLAFNAGRAGAHGWGTAMSTDTAFALGVLALLTPRSATRVRVFLLTLSVVDDLTALVIIATVYTSHVSIPALASAVGLSGVLLGLRYLPTGRGAISVVVAIALWVAMFKSGVDPVISGLAVGLATAAYPPARSDLEEASALARSFREQPTPELARSVQQGVLSAISANERMQYELHPWVSYAVLPLFALANAGIHVTGHVLSTAIGSPITLGVLLGYVLGKPVGHLRRLMARVPARAAGAAAAFERTGPPRRRRLRGCGLHGVAADREPGLQRRAADRGQAWRPWQPGARASPDVGRDGRDQAPAERDASAPDRPHRRGHNRSVRGRRSRARPHPRPGRCPGDPPRVRGLRVPLLRTGRAGRSASCSPRSAATCATCGAIFLSTTSTRELSWQPKPPRRRQASKASGRCTTRCSPIRTRCCPAI